MKSLLKLIIGSCCLISVCFATQQENLIFAVDIIRHGDRNPIEDFPANPYPWPQGLGALTALGMQQEYQLGISFRKLYIDKYHLLPLQYDINSMQIYSDTSKRTIQSAESVLYGLYPLGAGPKISKQFALPAGYQPIPILTTIKFNREAITPTELKTYNKLIQQQVFSNKQWLAQQQQWQSKFLKISKTTGEKIDTLNQLIHVGDNLLIRKIHHIPNPPGITAVEANQLIALYKQLVAEKFAPPAIGRILGTPLINQVKIYFKQTENKNNELHYVLFSAHDTTILAVMSALGVPLEEQPHYASDLKFLLFQTAAGKDVVEVFYNGKPVSLPFCQNNSECNLEKFLHI